ncbi:MAG: hypothetical protein Kow0027_16950 [Saprospiraceae bacterium]|jgi:hypothetical protein|nr:hypothetical protein [Saprospirales bacterium]
MTRTQTIIIEDLVEQILNTQEMVKLHQDHDDEFMVEQYIYRRNSFVKKLLIELLKVEEQNQNIIQAIKTCVRILEKSTPVQKGKGARSGLKNLASLESIA